MVSGERGYDAISGRGFPAQENMGKNLLLICACLSPFFSGFFSPM
jgi:hypothetical protein